MFKTEFDDFAKLIDESYALISSGKTVLPAGAKVLFFRAMESYSLETVSRAMTAHIRDSQRGQYLPKPADLIAQIEGNVGHDGRPGVEEAWALALVAQDEAETVIWTEEMRDAFGICRTVLDKGDEVGARMAFKDSYNRMIDAARRTNKPPRWELSPGRDPQKREIAIRQAETVGRLAAPQVSLLLPAPVVEAEINHEGLARLRAECAKLVPGSEKARLKREAELQADRERESARKREISHQVEEYEVSGRHKNGETA